MFMKSTIVFALAAALAPLAARAQTETPPRPAAPKNFSLPETRTLALDNGLKVSLIPFGTVPKVAVQLVVRSGNVDEGPNEIWLADLMGDLMREGTTNRSGEQISLETASMGGSLGVSVGPDESTVSGEVLSEFGTKLVALVADVAMNPAFPASELPRLKANRLRNVAISKSQQQPLAQEKFSAVLYPDHPYGRIFPTEEMVQGFTVEQIRAFYAAQLGAQRAHLFVAGVFDAAAMEQAVRDAFGGWKRGQPAATNVPQARTARMIHIVDRPGAVQSTVYIGLPVVDPSHADYVPLQVTNALLGGSFGSRITANIRENKGYTYSPSSFVSSRYRSAYWAEVADITTNVTGPAIQEIFNEIDRLQSEAPPADELKGIQNYLAGTFVLGNVSRGGLIGSMRLLNLHGLPRTYLTDYVKNVHAVTPAEVQRIANTYLKDGEMTIVIVGDRQSIEEQLKPIAPIAQ
jgi:zinc protease